MSSSAPPPFVSAILHPWHSLKEASILIHFLAYPIDRSLVYVLKCISFSLLTDYGVEKGIHLDGSREVRILKALREFAEGVVRL